MVLTMRDYTEKRASRRIPVECVVRFRIVGAEQSYQACSKNLSVGGIAIAGTAVVKPGDTLELQLLPPKGSAVLPLDALVTVTRSTENESGCEVAGYFKEVRA